MTTSFDVRRQRAPLRLGLRENAAQFTLLVAVNALVGGMVGQQQTTLPLLAEQSFVLSGYTFVFAYVAAFGVAKAASNYVAGVLSDRFGRKPVLLAGWLFALPVPMLIMWAPSWGWIVFANVLLGVNQGLAWSTTVTMKIDLVGPQQRGLAMGLNEAAGYMAVAATSLVAGWIAAEYGLRPAPFMLGLAYAAIAMVLVVFFVRETRDFVRLEIAGEAVPRITRTNTVAPGGSAPAPELQPRPARIEVPGNARIFADVTWHDPALSSASLAGLANNLNFGLSWGVFPLLFAAEGMNVAEIGLLVALYPLVWGVGQLGTGWLSDRAGRKPLVTIGMLLQALALAIIAASTGMPGWIVGTMVLGVGSALVYPALLAVIGDVAHPLWRGRAVGIYRVWRDLGYAAGALLGGVIADALSLGAAVWGATILSAFVALVVGIRLPETLPRTETPALGAAEPVERSTREHQQRNEP